MGLTKTEIFTDAQNEIARLAKVLGHPARIAILQHLVEVKACICGDLVDEIGLSQPTISQHLREMKDIGLVKGTIDGPRVCYCIDYDRLQQIRSKFDELFNMGVDPANCC